MRNKIFFGIVFLVFFTTFRVGAEDMVDQLQATEKATFAGGCFWCMEGPFEKLEGVKSVVSGYSGGDEIDPSYKEVAGGKTGHAEVVQITFDPSKISYKKLLFYFWRNINPTTLNRQFGDVGAQYRTAIFYHSESQKKLAEESRVEISKSGKFNEPIVTEISKFKSFYAAEEYHQDYYKKNPIRYKTFKYASGRSGYLKKLWGDLK